MTSRRPLRKAKCVVCGTIENSSWSSQHFRCSSCIDTGNRPPNLPDPDYGCGSTRAMSLVASAIRTGLIPPPATLDCVDCGKPANQYDHRDYNKPMEVDAVCRSCNLLRGPAIPVNGRIDRMLAAGNVPYRNKKRAKLLFERLGLPTDCFERLPGRLNIRHWLTIWPITN